MDKKPGESVFQAAYTNLKRPTTAAVAKMLQKLVPQYPLAQPKKKPAAADLQKLIEKATKSQKKAMLSQQLLVESLNMWTAEIPNEEVSQLMRDFTDLIESVALMFATQADRLNSFKVKLGAIASREDRQKALLAVHENLKKLYNDTALKLGPQAQQSTLYLDQIEESEYNLKLIEQQLARTASINLRAAITEYLTWLQGALLSLGQRSNSLAVLVRDGDPTSPVRRIDMLHSGHATGDFAYDSSKTSPLNMRPQDTHSGIMGGKKDHTGGTGATGTGTGTGATGIGTGSGTSEATGLRGIAEVLKRQDFFASNVAREHDADLVSRLRDKDQMYDIRNFEENREGWGMHS